MKAACRSLLAVFLLTISISAQTPSASNGCPADKPVDDLIAEIHKLQSKKSSRNKNPLPQSFCIWGWCRTSSKPPESTPPDTPGPEAPQSTDSEAKSSSSKTPSAHCDLAMDLALEAAHNVEVGDFLYEQRKYQGALSRYEEAAGQKAEDIAIHVRLGRVTERLDRRVEAIAHYQVAEKLAGPAKWSNEAREALIRLRSAK